jgi:hypothetical protein
MYTSYITYFCSQIWENCFRGATNSTRFPLRFCGGRGINSFSILIVLILQYLKSDWYYSSRWGDWFICYAMLYINWPLPLLLFLMPFGVDKCWMTRHVFYLWLLDHFFIYSSIISNLSERLCSQSRWWPPCEGVINAILMYLHHTSPADSSQPVFINSCSWHPKLFPSGPDFLAPSPHIFVRISLPSLNSFLVRLL